MHARYLCKRLRARFPKIKIIVGRWGLKGNLESNQQQLGEAGADVMAVTLLETLGQLGSLLPVLAYEQARIEGSVDRAGQMPRSLDQDQPARDQVTR